MSDEKSDAVILDELIEISNNESLEFQLILNGKSYPLHSTKIIKSNTPVTRPTTRGGVYFSDTFAYKLVASLEEPSIIPLLSKTMLGPNTEFEEIKITTKANIGDKNSDVSIFTNLTNSMQSSSRVELHLLIVKITLC